MKKCAVINDISGFGKCSLTASIPVMSAMGIEVHPVVTGVFSNQTGYENFESVDLTDMLPKITRRWQQMSPRFDGILTGFLLSAKQYEYVLKFIDTFKQEDTLLLADPVMGDNGQIYRTYTPEMVEGVKNLCTKANIITPNLTEVRILSGEKDIMLAGEKLIDSGIKSVIVTGVVEGGSIANFVFSDGDVKKYSTDFIESAAQGGSFSGTGDIFSSFVLGKILAGTSVFEAVEQATTFIGKAIKASDIKNRNDGIDFEPFLKEI
ncbi:MAG: PfkB family carbohydrate kinase [Eubacteriales bacterium]|nr:PfkB family carbohydrate kinase [Eubacteriales bacterium]